MLGASFLAVRFNSSRAASRNRIVGPDLMEMVGDHTLPLAGTLFDVRSQADLAVRIAVQRFQ
jgi:hypothetical protein